jgi:rhodanese-related sulfurtransferase
MKGWINRYEYRMDKGVKKMSEFKPIMGTITPEDAFELIKIHENDLDFIIIDIRPHKEYNVEHIAGAKNLDYDGHEFQKKVNKLDKDKDYVIYCRSGVRGGYFLKKMRDSGFKKTFNILGGFEGWKGSNLPLVKY